MTRNHYTSFEYDHMVPVVFDVVADSRRKAAQTVDRALALTDGAPLRVAFDAVNCQDSGSLLEAWWFPEAEDKPVDRNDRDVMHLIPATAEEEAWLRADECSRIAEMLERPHYLRDAPRLAALLRGRASTHLG